MKNHSMNIRVYYEDTDLGGNVDYLLPAYFDDMLTVDTKIQIVSPVRAYFYQNIFRQEDVIFKAEVCVTCTSTSGKVQRLPEKIKLLMT